MTTTNTHSDYAARAESELLRRKYNVKREDALLRVGLGDYGDIIRVTVEDIDLEKALVDFCDEVEDEFKRYLDGIDEAEKIIAQNNDQPIRTTAGHIRQAFVEKRSDRLLKKDNP